MRKLASIQTIAEIKPIENADAIEAARVNGWWVVTAKDNGFKVGDKICYIEIDSWVPTEVAPFLSKGKEPKEYNNVKGERLRTIKLRGQVSQGLIIPIPEGLTTEDGADISEMLNIEKWERPIPAQLQGQMKGNFPTFIRKTDQERIQNLPEVFDDLISEYEVSIKLDGSSMTVYHNDGVMGVCSRNIDLNLDQEGNTFVNVFKEIFKDWKPKVNFAIQGELMGPNIQGNREGLEKHVFYVFDIWNIDAQEYCAPRDVRNICRNNGLRHVPVLIEQLTLGDSNLLNTEAILAFAEGHSLNHPVREGLVFKRVDGQFSFKAISNKFLLKED
jgi:RNA ligase (TIGR02306 family)